MSIKITLIIAAAVLSLVSIAAPVAHWWSIPTVEAVQWFTALAALGVACAKVGLLPVAYMLWEDRKKTAIWCAVLGVLFMGVSVDTSTKYLESQTQARQAQSVGQSDKAQALKVEIQQIDISLATSQQLAADAMAAGYRSQASSFTDNATELRRDRRQAVEQLTELTAVNTTGAGFGFGVYGALIIALCFHVGAPLCVLAITAVNDVNSSKQAAEPVSKHKQETPKTNPEPVQLSLVNTGGNIPADYVPQKFTAETIGAEILAGRYGNPIVMGDANQEFIGSYAKLKSVIFSPLVDSGALVQSGNDYTINGRDNSESKAKRHWAQQVRRIS